MSRHLSARGTRERSPAVLEANSRPRSTSTSTATSIRSTPSRSRRRTRWVFPTRSPLTWSSPRVTRPHHDFENASSRVMRDAGQATVRPCARGSGPRLEASGMGLSAPKRSRFFYPEHSELRSLERSGTLDGLPRGGSPGWDGARENKRMIPTPDRSLLAPKKCNDLGERNR